MNNPGPQINCFICGGLYEFMSHYVGDQSCCAKCRQIKADTINHPNEPSEAEQERRRREYFGRWRDMKPFYY